MLADLDDLTVFLFCDAAHCSVPDLAPTCATDSSLENYNDARYSGFLPLCKPRPFSVSFSLLVNVFANCIVLGCFSLLFPSTSFLKNCPLAPCAFLAPLFHASYNNSFSYRRPRSHNRINRDSSRFLPCEKTSDNLFPSSIRLAFCFRGTAQKYFYAPQYAKKKCVIFVRWLKS